MGMISHILYTCRVAYRGGGGALGSPPELCRSNHMHALMNITIRNINHIRIPTAPYECNNDISTYYLLFAVGALSQNQFRRHMVGLRIHGHILTLQQYSTILPPPPPPEKNPVCNLYMYPSLLQSCHFYASDLALFLTRWILLCYSS